MEFVTHTSRRLVHRYSWSTGFETWSFTEYSNWGSSWKFLYRIWTTSF